MGLVICKMESPQVGLWVPCPIAHFEPEEDDEETPKAREKPRWEKPKAIVRHSARAFDRIERSGSSVRLRRRSVSSGVKKKKKGKTMKGAVGGRRRAVRFVVLPTPICACDVGVVLKVLDLPRRGNEELAATSYLSAIGGQF